MYNRWAVLRTVTPRDSSRDISLSQLFYLKSFPHFSTFSAHRTSPHFSVSFRTFPCFTFPCLPLSYYGYSPVLTFPCLLFHSPWFHLSFLHRTLVTVRESSLVPPYASQSPVATSVLPIS